ncbi:MAG: glycosyltransferase family 2 protein [Anaerolineales bacterium]
MQNLSVDLVIPVYNEAGVVEQTHANLRAVIDALPYTFSIIYVDDGSSDETVASLESLGDARVRILELSRNFGHQAALTAGMDASQGDVVISLDADGQHPPEMIPQMIALIVQGYDVVQAQRIEEQKISFKKISSDMFYSFLNKISGTYVQPGAADFRALSRQAVDALKAMPEYHRFLRGMISWIGFPSVILPYREPKRISGASKYSLGKMARLASDAIFSFSLLPLYIGLSMGGLFFLLAFGQIIYVLTFWVKGTSDQLAPGWSSLLFFLLIASGIIMVLLGFIGIYVGYIFQEVKRRPVYLLKQRDKKNNA